MATAIYTTTRSHPASGLKVQTSQAIPSWSRLVENGDVIEYGPTENIEAAWWRMYEYHCREAGLEEFHS